ncbi:hypothetical protein [Campylobacter coli]|uniref:hypothetical protein n=1 Tax=Campylobacter coli TaxID=195 RepID=UPI000FAD6A75|nr:hypothetical protein [Campylobacter coli]EAI7567476.1 hypothetical protein [Campylobacter coli]ECK6928785.1 hypothetical protein [Campylobacter coli]ECO2384365.1 hypothetical protein [Campylobacter coli]EHC5634335.1 hypothetical protein [Campylobacter coli]EHP0960190.1 hypothetical protein [Campylobacter coli]
MKLVFLIYIASILDDINRVFFTAGILTLACGIFSIILYYGSKFEHSEEFANIGIKGIKIFIPISIITESIAILTPSKQTAYLMAGAYIGNQVATSEFVNNRLEKIIEIIDLNLDKQIKELQGFKK